MNSTDRPRRRVALGLLLLLVSVSAGGAEAGDTKRYTGTNCQPAAALYASALSYGSHGKLTNLSSTAVQVVCPLIKDKMDETWRQWVIVYTDRHPADTVSCSLYNVGGDGVVSDLWTLSSTRAGVGRNSRGVWEGGCPPGTNCIQPPPRKDPAVYGMRCRIPGRTTSGYSSLEHYQLEEH